MMYTSYKKKEYEKCTSDWGCICEYCTDMFREYNKTYFSERVLLELIEINEPRSEYTYNNYEEDDYEDEHDIRYENCNSFRCYCSDIEREAGFVRNDNVYVCKDCSNVPVKCDCC